MQIVVSTKSNLITILGEIELNSDKCLDVEQIVRNSCRDVGYDHADKGLDAKQASIITELEIIGRAPGQ